MRRLFIGMALALAATACVPGAARGQAREDAARCWQRSYQEEAGGRFDGALEALDELPASDRGGYVYALRRGWLLYLAGRHHESAAAYQRAVDLAPSAIEPRLGRLLPLMALGSWREAEEVARQALRIDADNYLAASRLALVLYRVQRYNDAEALYRRVLALYPSDVEMQLGVAWCLLKRGRAKDAAAVFRAVLTLSPDNASAKEGLEALGR